MRDLMARMGHDSVSAAIIYQHPTGIPADATNGRWTLSFPTGWSTAKLSKKLDVTMTRTIYIRTAVHRVNNRPSVLLVNGAGRARTALDVDD